MAQNRTELTPRQFKAINVLLSTPEPTKAAAALRIGRTTLYAWMHEPAFKAELDRRRDEILAAALDTLKIGCTVAAVELAKLCTHHDPAVRRQACNDVLKSAFRQKDLDHDARIEALEAAISEKQ